jgi:hypothetical protein
MDPLVLIGILLFVAFISIFIYYALEFKECVKDVKFVNDTANERFNEAGQKLNHLQNELLNTKKQIESQFTKITEEVQADLVNLIGSCRAYNKRASNNAKKVVDFNDALKIFMDHAQQRAVRVLEFNDILQDFAQMVDTTAQSGSTLWIHDPFFRAFRNNLEEMIRLIEYHQKESLQSIQFLLENNETTDPQKT